MTGSIIKSIISRVHFSEHTIESFINSPLSSKTNCKEKINIPDQFEYIDWCSMHVPVQGSIEIILNDTTQSAPVQVPVSTGFIVGCIKNENCNFKMVWSRSLS